MVPKVRLELTRPYERGILNPLEFKDSIQLTENTTIITNTYPQYW